MKDLSAIRLGTQMEAARLTSPLAQVELWLPGLPISAEEAKSPRGGERSLGILAVWLEGATQHL